MMLEGKTALVTGARGGIGRAIAKRFVNEGAAVHAADLTPEGSLAAAVDKVGLEMPASGELFKKTEKGLDIPTPAAGEKTADAAACALISGEAAAGSRTCKFDVYFYQWAVAANAGSEADFFRDEVFGLDAQGFRF